MGCSQIFDLAERLEHVHWREEIQRTRLLHVAAQGSSKDLNKCLKPILQELDGGTVETNLPELGALLRKLN